MTRRFEHAATMAFVLAAVLPLAAQTSKIYRDGNSWVEEISGSLSPTKALKVSTEAGSVQLEGGAERQITYVIRKRVYLESEQIARRLFQSFRVNTARRGDTVVIEGTRQLRSLPKFTAEFSVRAPQQLQSAILNTEGGNIAASNLKATVEAASGGGNIRIEHVSGRVNAETGGGSLQLNDTPNALTLHTGGGLIRISGQTGTIAAESGGGSILVDSSQSASLETGVGSIVVDQCASQLRAFTGGGRIDVGQVKGPAFLEAAGGSIRLGGALGAVVARTGAGTVELYRLMRGARVESALGGVIAEFMGKNPTDSIVEASAGDVVIYLAPEVPFTVQAAIEMANGHQIRSDFPELRVNSEGGRWGAGAVYAEGALNGGGPVLKVRTVSGNIEFRRASRISIPAQSFKK